MSPDEYREEFGLNRSTGLLSPALRQKLSDRFGPHLKRHQPAVSIFASMSAEDLSRRPTGPVRAERRLHISEARRRWDARRPKKPKPPTLTNAEVRRRALAKIEILLEDPEWRAARNSAIARGRLRLTDEQIAEVRALRGRATQVEVARRYRIASETVKRIWEGEYGEG
jgi:hypothetical protein